MQKILQGHNSQPFPQRVYKVVGTTNTLTVIRWEKIKATEDKEYTSVNQGAQGRRHEKGDIWVKLWK